jgi:molybdate transport system substrate-binding protein
VNGLLLALLVLPAVAACGSDDDGSAELAVFAASSLTDAFFELGNAFEAAHPDARVTLNFGGSSTLAAQIVDGAPADVFASADEAQMTAVAENARISGEPAVFATNVLEIIVAPGNPLEVGGVADLAASDLLVVLAAPEVPVGSYTEEMLARAGVSVTARSFEENVKAVVSKVALGEADAGIVYATDARAAGDKAQGVEIPADVNVVARYPMSVLDGAAEPELAEAFVDFVLGETGQGILSRYGFGPP